MVDCDVALLFVGAGIAVRHFQNREETIGW
jgi:hypothetical protein